MFKCIEYRSGTFCLSTADAKDQHDQHQCQYFLQGNPSFFHAFHRVSCERILRKSAARCKANRAIEVFYIVILMMIFRRNHAMRVKEPFPKESLCMDYLSGASRRISIKNIFPRCSAVSMPLYFSAIRFMLFMPKPCQSGSPLVWGRPLTKVISSSQGFSI